MNLDLDSDYIHYAKTPHNTRCEHTLTLRFESVLPLLRNWGSVVTHREEALELETQTQSHLRSCFAIILWR
jgi:hypothetical protein